MIDNLEDAINHARKKAEELEDQAFSDFDNWTDEGKVLATNCLECAAEHKQLAIWLTQLKAVKDIVREFNDDTLGFTHSSSDFITAIIEAVSEEENEDK